MGQDGAVPEAQMEAEHSGAVELGNAGAGGHQQVHAG